MLAVARQYVARATPMRALTASVAATARTLASATAAQPVQLKHTALYDFHIANSGKMVEFAGWSMPVQYAGLGVLASHVWTRQHASLFDVSHMLQTSWTGKDRIRFMESLVVSDIESLPKGASTLSVFTNSAGGIIDDTVINNKMGESLYVVSNAGCADKDLKHVCELLSKFQDAGGDVDVTVLDRMSLIALQGPKAAKVLATLTKTDFSTFKFMTSRQLEVGGVEAYISRCGYTGEDGFEISVGHDDVERLSKALLGHEEVELAGLGARDSLRLEAGLCLYGHDLDETVSPVEAGLTWTIGKRRREKGGFLGSDKILPQIKGGVTRRRVGLIIDGAPAREGAEITTTEGETVGVVTSGCPSPMMKQNIGMGYVQDGKHKVGTELRVKVRQRLQRAVVTKMPFVEHRYMR